jgi:predicted DNA-binding protein
LLLSLNNDIAVPYSRQLKYGTVTPLKRPKKTPQAVTGRGSDKFILRLPEGMRAKIQALAAQKGRSMNSEIVAALERYVAEDDLLWDAIEELRVRIGDLEQRGKDLNED